MPRELPKSWSYLQHAWNNYARTAVASAIEAAVEAGDNKCVTFRLFADGSKKKRKKKKNKMSSSLRLLLPDDFDIRVHRIAALVNHFTLYHAKQPGKLYTETVKYHPMGRELDYITTSLAELIADPNTSDLSAA